MFTFKPVIIISALCIATFCTAQKAVIEGKILDKETKEGLAKVTIKAGGKYFLSNSKGNFSISLENGKLTDTATITISHVGYKDEIIKFNSNIGYLLIELEKYTKSLDSVVVSFTPRDLIEKAFLRAKYNYISKPVLITGFQRFYELINDSDFFVKNDALVLAYFPSIFDKDKKSKPQVTLLQNKLLVINNLDDKNEILLRRKIEWNKLYNSLKVFRFQGLAALYSNKRLGDFKYKLLGKQMYNGRMNYVIDGTDMRDDTRGSIFIDSATLAFSAFTYYLSPEHLSKKMFFSGKDIFHYIHVSFKQHEDQKWYLNNAHVEQWASHTLMLNGGKKDIAKAMSDFVTISIDTVNAKPLPTESQIKNSQLITEGERAGDSSKWMQADSFISVNNLWKYITELPVPQQKDINKKKQKTF